MSLAFTVFLFSLLPLYGRKGVLEHRYQNAIKVKVKSTLVQALRLFTGRTAHWGSRGTALLFHDHGTRRG
jgi:hypothetical protein